MTENVNKVVFENKVLIDLTGDTVAPEVIDKGFIAHDKSGAVIEGTSTKDSDTSDATLSVSEALKDKVFYANGKRQVGIMPNNGGIDEAISKRDQEVSVPVGFHDGSGKIGISEEERRKIIPENIKQGITMLGIPGGYSGDGANLQEKTVIPTSADQTILPDVGFDYLSSVVVKAIPYTETENVAGGTTVTIGG